MLEIRFHGRGGQGAVTSAELLAQAGILEGKYASAFPSFGPERRGAPVTAFCRIDEHPLILRTNIYHPDVVIVLDPSLLKVINVTAGFKDDGILIINSEKDPEHFTFKRTHRLATVNASHIALEILKRPITNTVLLGALIKVLPVVKMDSLTVAIEHRFNKKIAMRNIEALHRAYEDTVFSQGRELKAGNSAELVAGFATEVEKEAQKKIHKADADYLWGELKPGCVVTEPGNSKIYYTGDWRSFRPILQQERCIKCGICWTFCPDMAYMQDGEGFYLIDLNYCKGCGICARECPTGAIRMAEEKESKV